MQEFRVKWTQCPTAYNTTHVLFVEANSAADAVKIARNHIERKFGIEWLKIEATPVEDSIPAGRVVE